MRSGGARPGVKPGWILLLLLFIYSLVVTGMWLGAQAPVPAPEVEAPAPVVAAPQEEGLWFPVVGARLPQNPSYLPGAPRPYRRGVNQGFNFYSDDAGVPIPYGTPVIAAASGTVQRADVVYREPSAEEWQALLAAVADQGADDAQLNRLRGRQIVLETDDGYLLRYAHLANVRPGISAGTRVYRGQVLGYVGNSGTTEGVRGSTQGSRLHFEVWEPDGGFFGEDMDEETLRMRAASLFVGP